MDRPLSVSCIPAVWSHDVHDKGTDFPRWKSSAFWTNFPSARIDSFSFYVSKHAMSTCFKIFKCTNWLGCSQSAARLNREYFYRQFIFTCSNQSTCILNAFLKFCIFNLYFSVIPVDSAAHQSIKEVREFPSWLFEHGFKVFHAPGDLFQRHRRRQKTLWGSEGKSTIFKEFPTNSRSHKLVQTTPQTSRSTYAPIQNDAKHFQGCHDYLAFTCLTNMII